MNRYKFDVEGFDTFIVPVKKDGTISFTNEHVVNCFDILKGGGIINEDFCVHTQFMVLEDKLIKFVFFKLKEDEFEAFARSYRTAVSNAVGTGSKNIFIFNTKMPQKNLNSAAVYGSLSALYSFDKYKSDAKCCDAHIWFDEENLTEEEVNDGITYYRATSFCKDLVNEPANTLTPFMFAEMVKESCEGLDAINLKIFNKKDIEKLGMSAFLEVSKGSNNEPYLIVLDYNTDSKKERTALVGKGITFDSGGFSLKPTEGMCDMKTDMAGGAAVASCIIELARNNVKANVVGVIAACENIISSKAYKPGDVISSMIKKTIEIDNTDAEGRLTLADAVTYAVELEKAGEVITIATLTGAVIRSLGVHYTGVVSKEEGMYKEFVKASREVGDKIWLMPYDEVFKEGLKSKIADIKNTGGAYAGTISAGMFIEEFCKNKPFLHLDIAGTAWSDKKDSIRQYGATGVGANMLYCYIKNKSK